MTVFHLAFADNSKKKTILKTTKTPLTHSIPNLKIFIPLFTPRLIEVLFTKPKPQIFAQSVHPGVYIDLDSASQLCDN